MNLKFAICAIAVLLSGCASGYSQFYEPVEGNNEIAKTVSTPGTAPQVVTSSGDFGADVAAMFTQGYTAIGRASFNGAQEGMSGAIQQAKKVGATHVVMAARYTNTAQGAIPMQMPQTQTTHTSGRVNVASGRGGFASGSYHGTSTTYGTQTVVVPYSVDRYDQAAVFFAPLERKGLGVMLAQLTPTQVQLLGTGKAVFVTAVRTGSPAFKVDLLPGDFVKEINGKPAYERATMTEALSTGKASILINRGGKDMIKEAVVPPEGW